MKTITTLLAVFICAILHAQLTGSAGTDTTVCAGSQVILGANPTANGGTGPYTYYWSPSTGLSCNTCANPVATPSTSITYSLKVKDNTGDSVTSNVIIAVNPLPQVTINASDTVICAGQVVELYGSAIVPGPNSCGLTSACASTSVSSIIGSGTVNQPGIQVAYPSLFGNFDQSCRQQILYKASELQQALGGPATIGGINFDIGIFNSNAYLVNFTLKIGCTSADSITDWNNGLSTVINPFNFQPGPTWNNQLPFDTGYSWDGVSNIVVELCFYGAGLHNNDNNKAVCTVTPNSTYIYSAGQQNQCDTVTTPLTSNVRPNVKFSYCAASTPGLTYNWLPQTGADSIFSPTGSNTTLVSNSPTTYYLNVTDASGCIGIDSLHISPHTTSVTANYNVSNTNCNGQADGIIHLILSATDSAYYQLQNSNSTGTTFSGTVNGIDSLIFPSLSAGVYNLLITNSPCANITDVITVGTTALITADTTITQPICYMSTSGALQAMVFGGDSIGYKLSYFNSTAILDSGTVADSGTINITSLPASTYTLVLTDSGCTTTTNVYISALSFPILYFGNTFTECTDSQSNSSGCLILTGGDQPFTYNWSISPLSDSCLTNMPPGNFTVTVTDANNCSTVISDEIYSAPQFFLFLQIGNQPSNNSDSVTIAITGGVPPYLVAWGDSTVTSANDTATHRYFTAGRAIITITDSLDSTTSDTITISFISGITQNLAASIKVFPNPVNDQLLIESNEYAIDGVSIFDVTGKQVFNQYLQSAHQCNVDVSMLSEGAYLLSIKSKDQEYHTRFVKAK